MKHEPAEPASPVGFIGLRLLVENFCGLVLCRSPVEHIPRSAHRQKLPQQKCHHFLISVRQSYR